MSVRPLRLPYPPKVTPVVVAELGLRFSVSTTTDPFMGLGGVTTTVAFQEPTGVQVDWGTLDHDTAVEFMRRVHTLPTPQRNSAGEMPLHGCNHCGQVLGDRSWCHACLPPMREIGGYLALWVGETGLIRVLTRNEDGAYVWLPHLPGTTTSGTGFASWQEARAAVVKTALDPTRALIVGLDA